MKKFFLIFTPLLLFFILFSVTHAEGLIISEPIKEINLVPGGAEHFSVSVKNNTDKDLEINTMIETFGFIGDRGKIELFKDINDPFVKFWLKPLSFISFKLRAGEKRKSSFLISVPLDAENKGYYAAIYFEGRSDGDGERKNFWSNNSLIFLSVEAEESNVLLRGGEIERIIGPKFTFYGPTVFGVKFKNSGKIHYKTRGQIEVYNFLNRLSAVIPVEEKYVLPNSDILVHGVWPQRYLFGKYFVVARMFDGDGNSRVDALEVWAIPWQEFLIFAIIITLIIIARKLRVKRLKFE